MITLYICTYWHINHPVLSDNVNGPASVACQSLIIHHEECCGGGGEKSKHPDHSDEDDEATDEDDSEAHFQDSILDMYRNRHKSPEAMRHWQQIEKELFNSNTASKIVMMNNEVLPMEHIQANINRIAAETANDKNRSNMLFKNKARKYFECRSLNS